MREKSEKGRVEGRMKIYWAIGMELSASEHLSSDTNMLL